MSENNKKNNDFCNKDKKNEIEEIVPQEVNDIQNSESEDQPSTVNDNALDTSVGKKIAKATGALVLIQVFLRFFGLIETMVLSNIFGADKSTDAYFLARKITAPIMALGDQVIMHSFLPAFVQKMEKEGEKKGWQLASTIITLMIIVMVVIGVFGLIFTSDFLSMFGDVGRKWQTDASKSGIDIALTLKLTRIFIVAMIFLATSAITYCLLNSYKQFALPASSDLVLKAATLLIGVIFAREIGIIAFAAGFVIGALGKLLTQVIGLKIIRSGYDGTVYKPRLDLKDPAFKTFLLLALPLILGWAFSTFRVFLEGFFLSQAGTGGISYYEYAKKICDIPVTFFPYVFGIALFPFLTDIATRGEKSKLREMLTTATKIMLFIFIPLSIAVFLFREQIITILYASKNFSPNDVTEASATMSVYAFVMIVGALEIIVNQFFFASRDTLRPTITGICVLPFYALIAYIGVIHLGYGAVAVALALLVYRLLKIIALYTMVRKKTDGLPIKPFVVLIGKIALGLIPFVFICLLTIHFGGAGFGTHAGATKEKLVMLLPCFLGGGMAFIVYFVILYFLKTEELTLLVNKIRHKKLK